jgi:hypothetical protein
MTCVSVSGEGQTVVVSTQQLIYERVLLCERGESVLGFEIDLTADFKVW